MSENDDGHQRHHQDRHRREDQNSQQLTLAGLAYRRRWSALASRAALHPDEIDQLSSLAPTDLHERDLTSTEGWTLLHWVCCNEPPIEMLQSLFRHESAKRAACVQDAHGMTPLICACAGQASFETISLLLDIVPECIHIYDSDGWTPLHYICSQVKGREEDNDGHDADPWMTQQRWTYAYTVVQRLLQCDPTLAFVEDCRRSSPIHILCLLFRDELQSFHVHIVNRLYNSNNSSAIRSWDRLTLELVRGLWPMLQLMIDAAFSENPMLADSTVFHKIVALPRVMVDIFEFATALNSPDLMLERDAEGNTPLHLALLLRRPCNHHLLHLLLQGQQGAAKIRNGQGMLPLQLMLDQPWNSTHAAVIGAFPAAVETCGLHDEHYVRVLDLLMRNSTATERMTAQAIFEMLRDRPNLVRSCVR